MYIFLRKRHYDTFPDFSFLFRNMQEKLEKCFFSKNLIVFVFNLKSISTGSKRRTRRWFERSKITTISGWQQNERIRVQNQKRQSSERKRIKGNEIFRSRLCIRSDAQNLANIFDKKLKAKDIQTSLLGSRFIIF